MPRADLRLPRRYATVAVLGRGGGGEVWSVRDKLTGASLALKVLAEEAGEQEVMALVREASALSGLEGLGVPRVVAFGTLEGSKRRYLVREVVEGDSLAARLEQRRGEWIAPLAHAAEQLTVLHRAGLLHGDVKPANVIVGPDGRSTLVDLGLAAPWREGGSRPRGLTPRYAAPELFTGAPLTVRAEVYSLGAMLAEALAVRGDDLPPSVNAKLETIAARASEENPQLRHPSVDEFSQELRSAADLPPAADTVAAWPVLGLDAAAQSLLEIVKKLEPRAELQVVGPAGAGKSTLLRRIAWTLGAAEVAVFHLELGKDAAEEAVIDEIESAGEVRGVLVVDGKLSPRAEAAIGAAKERGARVVRASEDEGARSFAVPPLADEVSRELVRLAMPSLHDTLAEELVRRAEGRPGRLRRLVKTLRGRTVVSLADLEHALAGPGSIPPAENTSVAERFELLSRALDTGRFDEADAWLVRIGAGTDAKSRALLGLARARLGLARGGASVATSALEAIAADAKRAGLEREVDLLRARSSNRAGDFERAAKITEALLAGLRSAPRQEERKSLLADALASRGVALAFMGQDAAARKTLEEAVVAAKDSGDDRVVGVAWGSLAIGHQRSGHNALAREAYENALVSAEAASDAWTMVTTRLNLASLAQSEGDLVRAIAHLEAAVDLGTRAGGLGAVQQARLNLANLDLYLGRYARARTAFETLRSREDELSPNQVAHLLSLRAQLAANTGNVSEGSALYEEAARAYDALGRSLDAAEARLERLLTLAREGREAPVELAGELGRIEANMGEGGFGEHEPVAALVRGILATMVGDEAAAQRAFDLAISSAERSGRPEWQWRALDARAKLGAQQGSHAHARRDTEAALALLEEIASKLPRDLREVFWDDPRRRALREAHTTTMPFTVPATRAAMVALRGSSRTSTIAAMPAEDRLALIFEITRELAREHDMERLLAKVTDQAVALASADRGLVLLVGEDGTLNVHTARDRRGEDEAHASFSRSVAERVLESGEPVVATSAKDDERLAKAVSVHQLMIQSVACVPIRGAPPIGRPIGALYLETRLRPGVRFKDELATLGAFADQAAIAIENARLLGELRAREGELKQTNKELELAKEKLAGLLGRRTEQLAATRRDLKVARAELRSHFGYHGLVGTSDAMRRLYALLERVKDADVPVLITGESGTGKEMIAKAVHTAGARSKASFIGVNCGAIPENLLESELFGHKRGAFTGAERDKKGLFQEAAGGTILLDEIGEMPLKMQAGLLRVLQERTVRPVGAAHEEPVDVRVLAATNRDLAQMVAEGTFREDLYYRLNVVLVTIPPLRERIDDIVPLADHFLTLFAARYRREKKALSRGAAKRIAEFDWPGNVRQLEHVLLNAWLMAEDDEIEIDDISLPISGTRARTTSSIAPPSSEDLPRTKEAYKDAEKSKILEALERAGWNRVQAAKLVGIPRRTFYRRLKDYGIV